MSQDYSLPLRDGSQRAARRWFLTGVAALAAAGIFSILIVLARTPALASVGAFKDFFHVALVVHVDLSVLVWFLAVAGMMWSWLGRASFVPLLQPASLWCFGLGALLMALSPLAREGAPVMSNYIPVLTNGLFFIGLALVCAGLALVILNLAGAPGVDFAMRGCFSWNATPQSAQVYGIFTGALIAALALACFYWSGELTPASLDDQAFYETLFWAGGHVLQFTHTQLMLVAWLWLVSAMGLRLPQKPFLFTALFTVGLLSAFMGPLAYLRYGVTNYEFRQYFTQLMIGGNGLAPAIAALCIGAAWLKSGHVKREFRALRSSLAMSLLLFAFGGALGMMIQGQNVTIPAHYHGSIVAVTIAFMGFSYAVMPQLRLAAVSHTRLAYWQPIVYGVGQLIHISALAWSGGYGVLRKTPGALDAGMSGARIAMGVMGLGGLIAIIGGLMFVVVVIRSLMEHRRPSAT